MNANQIEAVEAAVRMLGSNAALARALGVTAVTVGQWLRVGQPAGRAVPPKQCVRIEKLTRRQVTRQALRPDDYWEIWPELDDRPPVDAAQSDIRPAGREGV